MKKALELARKGEGYVNPNPLVGAVIVKDKDIMSFLEEIMLKLMLLIVLLNLLREQQYMLP